MPKKGAGNEKELNQFHSLFPVPDRVNTHGAPGFFVNVIESDGGTVVHRLLLRRTLALRHVFGRDEVRAGRTSSGAKRAVFLDKLKIDYTLIEGFS